MNCVRTFLRIFPREGGAALLEAAATIGPTLMLIFGTIELALMFVQYQAVETAAAEAARATIDEAADLVELSSLQDPEAVNGYYRAKVSEGIFYSSRFDYDLHCYENLTAAAAGSAEWQACPADWVVAEVTASFDYSAMTHFVGALLGDRTITAKALVIR